MWELVLIGALPVLYVAVALFYVGVVGLPYPLDIFATLATSLAIALPVAWLWRL